MIIYKITNLLNEKIYIGKDSKNDPNYYGSGIIIKKAILKYGISNFVKDVIEHCETLEVLNDREKYWIRKFDSRNPDIGYNISEGGDGCNLKDLPNYEEIKKRMDKSPHLRKSYIEKYGETRASEIIEKKSKTYKINGKTKGDLNSSKRPDVKSKISNSINIFIEKNPDFIQKLKNMQKIYVESVRGKTFEEIYGNEYSIILRKKISDSKIGDLNPSKKDEVRKKISKKLYERIEKNSEVPNWFFLKIESGIEYPVGKGKLKYFCELNNISLGKVKYRLTKSDIFIFCGWEIRKA